MSATIGELVASTCRLQSNMLGRLESSPLERLSCIVNRHVEPIEKELAELRAKLAAMEEMLRWRTLDEEPDWSKSDSDGFMFIEFYVDTVEMGEGYRVISWVVDVDRDTFYEIDKFTHWRPALPGPGEE